MVLSTWTEGAVQCNYSAPRKLTQCAQPPARQLSKIEISECDNDEVDLYLPRQLTNKLTARLILYPNALITRAKAVVKSLTSTFVQSQPPKTQQNVNIK